MLLVSVEFACKDEEVVAESVDIGNDVCIHLCPFLHKCQDAAFCASADSAADMGHGGGAASPWQNEAAEGGQRGIDGIYFLFELGRHLWGHNVARTDIALRVVRGQISAHDKEFALNVGEHVDVVLLCAVGDEQTYLRTKFVDGAVGFETCAGLADALSANE